MSIDLVVPSKINTTLQPIQDQDGDASALLLASNGVRVSGQDIVGLPLLGNPVGQGQQTAGRLLRLTNQSGPAGMFDFAIDGKGSLQIYAGGQITNSSFTISTQGVVTIPNLVIADLTVSNLTASDLTVTNHLSAGA